MARRRRPPRPFDPAAAAKILEDVRAGKGLAAGLKRARVSQRTFAGWLAKSGREGPEAAPYREFRAELGAILERIHAAAAAAGRPPRWPVRF